MLSTPLHKPLYLLCPVHGLQSELPVFSMTGPRAAFEKMSLRFSYGGFDTPLFKGRTPPAFDFSHFFHFFLLSRDA